MSGLPDMYNQLETQAGDMKEWGKLNLVPNLRPSSLPNGLT